MNAAGTTGSCKWPQDHLIRCPIKESFVSISIPYPVQLEFHGDPRITRWRPLVQWLLVIPHLMIA